MEEGNFGQFGVGNAGSAGGSVMSGMPVYGTGMMEIPQAAGGRKIRKWVVVTVIAMVFVLVAVGVFVVWKNNEAGEAEKVFNRYANYLLYGEEKSNDISLQYDRNLVFALDCEEISDEECKEFFARSKELLNDFLDLENNVLEESRSEDLNYLKQTFDDYYTNIMVGVLSEDEITRYYEANGYDETLKKIETFYRPYLDSADAATVSYGAYKIEEGKLTIDLLEQLNLKSCSEGEVCDAVADEELIERELDLSKNTYMKNYMSYKRNDLIKGTIFMAQILDGVIK